MELDEIQRASQAQFAARSRSYGSSHILADVSDVASALEKIALRPKMSLLALGTPACISRR